MNETFDEDKILAHLNKILEFELAGVVRYTHYSLMAYRYGRLPVVSWLREQATETLQHAQQAGELITHLGGHLSLGIGPLLETCRNDIGDILCAALDHEQSALVHYHRLLTLTQGHSILLEEYAKRMIARRKHAWESAIRCCVRSVT